LNTLLKNIPLPILSSLKRIRNSARRFIYAGDKRFCPVCSSSLRRFVRLRSREEAICPFCLSFERHRFVWLFLRKENLLLENHNLKMLHIAPEPALEKLFKEQINEGYLTADLLDPGVMIKMDITSIEYPDESFNAVFCSHVLEHVDDDKKAMNELFRVLKTNCWAIFMVPINSDKTIEDPSVTDPAERLKLFGQEDHVRSYGPDFTQRLEAAGFNVKVISPNDFLTNDEMIKMGVLDCTGDIFYCTKY
jgi:hypothetical protein